MPPRRGFNRRLLGTGGICPSACATASPHPLAIPPLLWYIRSIHAVPLCAASTLTTAYDQKTWHHHLITAARLIACTWPHPRASLPFLPPALPLRCHLLPFLPRSCRESPPAIPATPLESPIRKEDTLDTRLKNGKNGNVHHPGQHCHPTALSPTRVGGFRGQRPQGAVATACRLPSTARRPCRSLARPREPFKPATW